MEVSLSELKEKEIINVCDGKKMGRIMDILFDNTNGIVKGVVVPGEKRLFRKSDDVFIPLSKLKKIGDDVILVSLPTNGSIGLMKQGYVAENQMYQNHEYQNRQIWVHQGEQRKDIKSQNGSFIRYKRIDDKKYK